MEKRVEEKRAVLIAVDRGGFDVEESLDELEALVRTIDIEPVERVVQRRRRPDPARYFGKGKLEKVAAIVQTLGADYVVVDDEISPVQAKNIEDVTKATVMDRTQVILEIFARHATTEEGKIQVELARLQYELPRIVGLGEELSRLGGGIGTRGPGEQLLQRKRSEIKKRISILKRRLEEIRTEREVQRKRRKERGIYKVSIVGYTNAGKSSLLNALSGSDDAKVEDALFATLEPITRRVKLESGRVVLFSDTVGFIRKLPHTIVAAFRATLEEIKESDLLIHLVDLSDPYYKTKIKESVKVLEEIGASEIPTLLAFNKIDLVPKERVELTMEEYPDALFLSVKKGIGIRELLERVDHELSKLEGVFKIRVPSKNVGKVYSSLDRMVIEDQYFLDGYVEMTVRGRKEVVEEIIGRVGGEILE